MRIWRKRNHHALLVGMQTGVATLENSMEVPQKTKHRITLRPRNCTTRHLSKGYRCAVSKGHVHPNVNSSTINNSRSMERAQMSIDGWMDKEDVVYIYTMEYYSAIKKNEILPSATTWMELEGIMLSEISQSEKDICDFTHMKTLRDKTDEHKGRETKII